MTGLTFRRAIALWFLLIAGTLLLGAFRSALTKQSLDPKFVLQLADLAGAALVLIATFYLVEKLETRSTRDLLLVGAIWVVLTVLTEVLFHRFVMHDTWGNIFLDYDLLSGRLWLVVLAALFLGPFLMTRLHGIEDRDAEGYLRR